jgi:hypothetical protein
MRHDARDPVGKVSGPEEIRHVARSTVMATGTLACPRCDAPVSPGGRPLSPADALACPFCRHGGAVRDFLSLDVPARPARVEIRVLAPRLQSRGAAARRVASKSVRGIGPTHGEVAPADR